MLAVLCVVALAGVAVTLGALVVLHLAPTGLSPLRDPVSAYGISRFGALYRVQTLGTAVAAAALAIGLSGAGVTAAAPAVAALIVLAVTRGVISWVPMDADGVTPTSTGRAHDVLAFGAFAAASVGGVLVGIAFGSTDGLTVAAPVATTLGWVTTGASALTVLASAVRALRPAFGLAERLIYLGMLAWLATTAVALMLR